MKKTANQLHEELTKKLITENYVDLHPISTFEATPKLPFETKFANFLAEKKGDLAELKPIVNTDESINNLKDSEGISADSKAKFEGKGFQSSYKVDKTLENIDSHNYDYDTTVENINNVNGEELLKGVQLESSYNSQLTLDEAKELVIKNLAKDPLHYVKEGQFGVKGVGYTQPKSQKADGKSAGSGYGEKLKDSDNTWDLVKESLGGVVTRGRNPWKEIMENWMTGGTFAEAKEKTEMGENAKPDFMDIDGDGDKEESMKKAGKDKKARKPKKETIDTKLAEIGKEAEEVKMEAQLDFLHDHIQEKVDRVSSIQEDENLSELIDKTKMKQMQREIKDLERKKMKMERIYEKSCGKKYSKKEMVDETEELDEMDAVSWNDKNNPTRGAAGERDPKKVGQSTSAYAINEGYDKDGKTTSGTEGTPVWEVPKDTQDPELKPYAGKYLAAVGGTTDGNGKANITQIEPITKDSKSGWMTGETKSIKPTGLFLFGKVVGYKKPDKSDPDYEAKKAASKYTMKPEDREKKQKVKAAQASGDFSTLTFKKKDGQMGNLKDNPVKYILASNK